MTSVFAMFTIQKSVHQLASLILRKSMQSSTVSLSSSTAAQLCYRNASLSKMKRAYCSCEHLRNGSDQDSTKRSENSLILSEPAIDSKETLPSMVLSTHMRLKTQTGVKKYELLMSAEEAESLMRISSHISAINDHISTHTDTADPVTLQSEVDGMLNELEIRVKKLNRSRSSEDSLQDWCDQMLTGVQHFRRDFSNQLSSRVTTEQKENIDGSDGKESVKDCANTKTESVVIKDTRTAQLKLVEEKLEADETLVSGIVNTKIVRFKMQIILSRLENELQKRCSLKNQPGGFENMDVPTPRGIFKMGQVAQLDFTMKNSITIDCSRSPQFIFYIMKALRMNRYATGMEEKRKTIKAQVSPVREQLKYNLGILTVRLYENVRKTVYQQHREFIDEIDEMSEEHPPEWIETAKEWVILAARLCLTKCHKAVSNKQEEIIEKPELLEKIFETAERMKIDSIHQYQVRNLTRKKRKKKMKDLNQQYYVDKVKGRQTQDEYHLDLIE